MSELISEIAKQQHNKMEYVGKKQYLKNGITKQSFKFDGFSYCLINNKNLFCSNEEEIEFLVNTLANAIKKLAGKVSSVLVVGLGNRHLSADGLGSETLKKVIATRELIKAQTKVSAISTGVLGLTGIESADIIESVASTIKPQLIILIDTLCATDYNTLGGNFQLSTKVLAPGHGVGNKRKSLNALYNKAKVLSIGVPLVVYAKSFISSAINNAMHNGNSTLNISDFNELLKNNFNNLVLTPKDINLVVKMCGGIIGSAINLAFNNYSISEQRSILQNF